MDTMPSEFAAFFINLLLCPSRQVSEPLHVIRREVCLVKPFKHQQRTYAILYAGDLGQPRYNSVGKSTTFQKAK
ncbi:hypothetical protein BDR06DRAFT_963388 [Suillus hirtellus]|nr:hypothetical protein BDR06DRAFT_963388 [Suillus hirtellus]